MEEQLNAGLIPSAMFRQNEILFASNGGHIAVVTHLNMYGGFRTNTAAIYD